MTSIRHRLLLWLLPGLGLLWGAAGTAIYQSVRHGLKANLNAELRHLIGPARFVARAQVSGPVPDKFQGSDLAAFNEPNGGIYFQFWNSQSKVALKSKSLAEMEFSKPDSFPPQGVYNDILLANGQSVRTLTLRISNNSPSRSSRRGPRFDPSRERPPFDRIGRQDDTEDQRGESRPIPPDRRSGFRGGSDRSPDRKAERGGPGRGPNRGPDREEVRRGPEHFNILIAKSRMEVDQTLGLLLGGITISGLVAALASTLLIRFALQSGLKPLEAVGEQASRIDANSLQERFPIAGMPAELIPIAERLNELLNRMEQSFERERRFSADLAHELRTPVAELKTMAEVAIKWPEQATAENYKDVQEISERMQGTIENLLMLARLENNRAQIAKEPIRLQEFTDSIWRSCSQQAAKRDLSLNISIGKDETVTSDPKLMGLILTNLLSNAADHAPKKSSIKIIGATDENKDQIFATTNPAPDLKAEDVSHLFERLWRKDKARTNDSHSGLGLAIAHSCAEVLNLELTAKLADQKLTIALGRRRGGEAVNSKIQNPKLK